jgi:predicted O-methyltransferase YrrM
MKATTVRFSLVLAIGATAAFAQNPDRPSPPAPLMQALDSNRDGRIDAAELAKAGESLKGLDRDQDGALSAEELRPQPGRRGPAEGPQRGDPQTAPPFASESLAKSDREKEVLAVLKDIFATQRQGSMSVPEDDGRILRLLVETLGATKVVEIGTSVGYSGVWIGLGLQATGGKLTTFEIDEGRAARARGNFKRAGMEDLITIVMGDAHETIKQLKDPIDLLFLDADKEGYLDYFTKLLPLLRPGGLIVAHNINQRQADPRFIKAITTNPAVETLFLNLQTSGISVTMKKR